MSATALMSETNPCLPTASSSITMMRILLLIQRRLDNDLCATFFRAPDRQHATHLRCTLAHADQTEVTVSDLFVRIKAAPVIANAEPHAARVEVNRTIDRVWVGVLHCIVNCLLSDTQEFCFAVRR